MHSDRPIHVDKKNETQNYQSNIPVPTISPLSRQQGMKYLQQSLGNSRVAQYVQRNTQLHHNISDQGNSLLIQRKIFYNHQVPQFEVDGNKPSFMGVLAKMKIPNGKSRDHIVPYAAIENDLAVYLNDILANNKTTQDLIDFTETLFPNKTTASYKDMVTRRGTLITELTNNNNKKYETSARALLSVLNSSEDNVRLGDSNINSSIGENLDANFLPNQFSVSANGLSVQGPNGIIQLAANTKYLRLEPKCEQIIYAYQDKTTQGLSFVLSAITGVQLSSETAPSVATKGLPVIVFGTSAMDIPYYYN